MKYIEENLLQDEKLIFTSKMHWIILLTPVRLAAAALLILIFGHDLSKAYPLSIHLSTHYFIALVLLLLTVRNALTACVRYITSEYGITNHRVIRKTGLINQKTLELFTTKIEAIDLDQSLLGKLLDYGTIRITGTGGTKDTFLYVRKPSYFRKTAGQQLNLTDPSVTAR